MELIVDANILLASFLKEAVTREILLDERLTLLAPEHLLSETSRHLKDSASLRKRICLSNQKLQELFSVLTQRIRTLPAKSYQFYWKEAVTLAPHEEDAPYLALALSLNLPIWSNDRGLKIQKRIRVYSTPELLVLLEKRTG